VIRRYGKKLAGGLLAATMVVVAGCQPVGGVDVNQSVVNNFKVVSSEAAMNVAIELIPQASATPEQKAALDKLKNISITFNSKTEDAQHASYDGFLTTARGKISFNIYTSGEQTVIKIEGASKPIVLNVGKTLLSSLMKGSNSSSMTQSVIDMISAPLMQKSADLLPLFAGFIATHVETNPKNIQVTPVTETVQGKSLNLNKLHSEISGTEAGQMLQKLMTSIVADEKGMKELLGSLYDVLAPEILKNKDSLNPLVAIVISNKETAVNFLYGMVQEYAVSFADQTTAKIKTSEMFTDQMYVKSDLYLDSGLLARKSAVEALLPVPASNTKGLNAIKITASGESWNQNTPVKADTYAVSGDSLQIGGSESGKLLNPSKLLSLFSKQSTAYLTFREDMQLTRKRLAMKMGQDAGQDPGESGKPFIKNGFTLVPVRYVVEQLDAEVKWDGDKREVTVKDELTGNVIVFTIGSKTALLNGNAVTLDTEAIINSGGSTYVPVRFITEQGLGGTISWDDNTRTVSIARD
jgi:hypothetical protein